MNGPKTPPTPTPKPAPPKPVVPPAVKFVWPIDRPIQTTDFCDQKYHDGEYGTKVKGFWHTGIDLNVGGLYGNQDAGKPVRAVAAGKAVYCAYRTAGGDWGPVVVIEHRLANGTLFWTRYAHLGNVTVKVGEIVQAGQQIAVIGLPSNWGVNMFAHLHFDWMRVRPPTWSHWPKRDGPKSEVTGIYDDPERKLKALVV